MENFLPGSRRLACAALLLAGSGAIPAADLRVASPSGILGITFTLDPDGAPLLSVDDRGRPLVLPSRLAITGPSRRPPLAIRLAD